MTSTVQRGITFVLLPVFALVLSPAEFGQIGLVGTTAAVIGALLGLGLETSVFRTLVQLSGRDAERQRFLNTVGVFAIVVPIGAAGALAIPVGLALENAYGVPLAATAFGLVAAGLSISVTSVCFASLRADEQHRRYVFLGAAQMVLHAGLPLFLVVGMGAGVLGWFGGTALGAALLLPIGIIVAGHRFSGAVDRTYLTAALAFGLPMVPHALAHWGLALSDRIVLGTLVGTTDLGIYHVAYQFGLPIYILAAALSQSVQPLYAETTRHGQSQAEIQRVATYQALVVAYVGAAVAVLSGPVVHLVLPPAYSAAAPFIPWIALGMTFFGLYLIPMNAIVLLVGRNRWVWVFTALAAVSNVALNLLLIPRYGVAAAAVNTALAYGLLLLGVAWYGTRVAQSSSGYEVRRLVIGMGLVTSSLLLLTVETGDAVIDLAVRTFGLAALAIVLLAAKLFPAGALRLDWARTPPMQSGERNG